MWQKTRLYTSASNDEDASSTIATNARGADAGMAMVNAMQKFSIKVDEINSTAKPAQLQATKNRMLGTTLLMLVLPEPLETLTNIFENATGTREMSKLFLPGRKTTERAMGASDHFILKGTNMPKIQPALLSFMAVGNYHTSAISSLSETNQTGLAPICLIPDNKDSTKKRPRQKRRWESLMRSAPPRLTQVSRLLESSRALLICNKSWRMTVFFFQFGSLFGLGICENQKQPNQQFNGQLDLSLEVRTTATPYTFDTQLLPSSASPPPPPPPRDLSPLQHRVLQTLQLPLASLRTTTSAPPPLRCDPLLASSPTNQQTPYSHS